MSGFGLQSEKPVHLAVNRLSLYTFLFGSPFQLRQHNTGEDQNTSDVSLYRHTFIQQQHSADGGKDRFGRENDSRQGGIGREFLANDLKRIGNAGGHERAVGQRDRRAADILEKDRLLEQKRRHKTENTAHQKLQAGKADGAERSAHTVDHDNMTRPEKGADKESTLKE